MKIFLTMIYLFKKEFRHALEIISIDSYFVSKFFFFYWHWKVCDDSIRLFSLDGDENLKHYFHYAGPSNYVYGVIVM